MRGPKPLLLTERRDEPLQAIKEGQNCQPLLCIIGDHVVIGISEVSAKKMPGEIVGGLRHSECLMKGNHFFWRQTNGAKKSDTAGLHSSRSSLIYMNQPVAIDWHSDWMATAVPA